MKILPQSTPPVFNPLKLTFVCETEEDCARLYALFQVRHICDVFPEYENICDAIVNHLDKKPAFLGFFDKLPKHL